MNKTRPTARLIIAELLFAAIVAAGAFGVQRTGILYVGADRPGPKALDDFLGTASDRSVTRHASGIKAPPLDRPGMVEAGFRLYDSQCAQCHGTPGAVPGIVGKGLSPDPPDLTHDDLKPAELFWVTKHGIRMTGMPAWSRTQSDDTLWDVVAFIQQLQTMSPDAYRAMASRQAAGKSPSTRGAAGSPGNAP